ncbi:MAG: prepilin-type N-terminal cleavage/methylation domain-containing protein [Eubacteriaceae bacterium]|jgi:prepilin-type N-terminal cleavage/methylation domain-containing protein|uniref:Prepilin-type N-terminal cleavage/methylation domain-containing protein n=1 Tax=Candidatus Pseudoramibacter fermentans TaxID=2594427 RepID=A0A6L5GTT8_9FIRM|nr:prepilin-type N-terminal cleavage/methylation domain-containing protein [Candidatus Pseudoramibacter fermentans]RRF92775.1 MAG: prepilin-type N-terminal cleavage/methylation domain-containing protein [Eubacteriaceae bacterium]
MTKSKQIKKRSNQKGFTLAEMLVTLIIIGVLAGVMIVAVPQIVNRSRTQVDKANAKQVTSAVTLYEADQGALPTVTAASNTNAAYDEVVQLLITNKYLKKEADNDYSAKAKDKVFVYDKVEGVVSVADKE